MNIMNDFYIAVDFDGTEWFYQGKPERYDNEWIAGNNEFSYCQIIKGTIESIIGHPLTWNDEPVPVKLKVA